MRAADSMRGVGTEPFELRKGRAGSYKSIEYVNVKDQTVFVLLTLQHNNGGTLPTTTANVRACALNVGPCARGVPPPNPPPLKHITVTNDRGSARDAPDAA